MLRGAGYPYSSWSLQITPVYGGACVAQFFCFLFSVLCTVVTVVLLFVVFRLDQGVKDFFFSLMSLNFLLVSFAYLLFNIL